MRNSSGRIVHLSFKDHGVPQNRPRVYFVGILRIFDQGTFQFPAAIPLPGIARFLDKRLRRPSYVELPPESQAVARANVSRWLQEIEEGGSDPFFDPWIIDCDGSASYSRASYGVSPCLTRSRCCYGHWVSNLGRRLNTGEILRLQGFDVTLPTAVPDRQLRMLLGNSMSLNVICRIFCYLLPAAGLSDGLRDSFLDTDTGSSLSPIKPCVKRHRLA